MAELLGGFDQEEINDGLKKLAQARSIDEIKNLIDSLPVLSSPIFHANFRQLRLKFVKDSNDLHHFLQIYDLFFTLLHYKIYRKENLPQASDSLKNASVYAPPFFLALYKELNGKIPADKGPTYNLLDDPQRLQEEVYALTETRLTAVSYKPEAGALWTALIVKCTYCGSRRLVFRANYVNVHVNNLLAEKIINKQVNNDSCESCGESHCWPIRIWLTEGHLDTDPLAFLSCIYTLHDSAVVIYQPPPGTTRNNSNDRILEVRLEMLLRNLAIDIYGKDRVTITNRVVYELDELIYHINKPAHDSSDDLEVHVQNITQKIESGILPLYQAEVYINTILPHSLLISWEVDLISTVGNSTEAIIRSLISEACAKAKQMTLLFRASLAANTAQLLIGSKALAQIALSRAEDLFTAASPEEVGYKEVEISILNIKSEVLQSQDQHKEAALIRKTVLEHLGSKDNDRQTHLAKLVIESADALGKLQQEDFKEAIVAMNKNISSFETFNAGLAHGKNDPDNIYPEVLYNHSGAMANLSFAYISISQYWELFNVLSKNGPDDVLSTKYIKQKRKIATDESMAELHAKILRDTVPVLENYFPNGLTPELLLEHAINKLTTAIEMARQVNGHEFLAIQTHRLALILDEKGETSMAISAMHDCIHSAAKAEDFIRLKSAYAFLGQHAFNQKNGKEALDHFRNSSRFHMKELIRKGGTAGENNFAKLMGDEILDTVELGGNLLEAILTVESLKSVSTAISLSRGIPFQANMQSGASAGMKKSLDNLLRQRETYRLQAIWNIDDRDLLGKKISEVESEIQHLRHEVSLRDPAFVRWADSTDVELAEERIIIRTLNDLGNNTTILGFVQTGKHMWTYACWNEGQISAKREIPDELLILLNQPYDSSLLTDRSFLEVISYFILDPVSERLSSLGRTDRLIVSPDEPFDMIPFGALPFGDNVLCEMVLLSVVQGLGVLEACAKKPSRPVQSMLTVCAPKRPDDILGLPGALAEASLISRIFADNNKEMKLLVGREATITAIKRMVNQYDALHFACHATIDRTDHAWSQLMLTPEVQSKESGNLSEDRILAELTLKEGCLVNLAGCSTGIQGAEKNHLRSGLVPSFLAIGAGSVMASLWPINDDAASLFQAAFYKKITAGERPAYALAATQRDCKAGKLGNQLMDINNWGSYIIYGLG